MFPLVDPFILPPKKTLFLFIKSLFSNKLVNEFHVELTLVEKKVREREEKKGKLLAIFTMKQK